MRKLIGGILISVIVLGCRSAYHPDLDRERNPANRKNVGVMVNPNSGAAEVSPYVTYVRRGNRVEWYSPDGTLKIDFHAPGEPIPAPIGEPECQQRGCGGLCSLLISPDQREGRYPYFAFITTPNGRVYKANQPELIVKGAF